MESRQSSEEKKETEALEEEKYSPTVNSSFGDEYKSTVAAPLKKSFLESFKDGLQKTFGRDGPIKVTEYKTVTNESRFRTESYPDESESGTMEIFDSPSRINLIHSIMTSEIHRGSPMDSNERKGSIEESPELDHIRSHTGLGKDVWVVQNQRGAKKLSIIDEKMVVFGRGRNSYGESEEHLETDEFCLTPNNCEPSQRSTRSQFRKGSKSTFVYTKDLVQSYRSTPVSKKAGSKWESVRRVLKALELDNK